MNNIEAPYVTLKWRENEPPYIEIRQNEELIVAGWVHPTPTGPALSDSADQIYDDDLVW